MTGEEPGLAPPSRKVSRSRSERRSKRVGSRRRRKARLFTAALAVAMVIVAAAVGSFVLLSGRSDAGDGVAPGQAMGLAVATTDGALSTAEAAVAVIVTGSEGMAAVVVLQPRGQGGGVAIAMPPDTLVKTSAGLQTFAALHAAGQEEALRAGIGTILGVGPDAIGRSEVPAIQEALAKHGAGARWPDAGAPVHETMAQAAAAVLELTGLASPEHETGLGDLPVAGGSLRESVARWSKDVWGVPWEAVALPGTAWEGAGFAYYEADLMRTGALLAGGGNGDITLRVENGSGAVGAAEAAGALLASVGHTMAPFANAPGFPNVRDTRIEYAPGAAVAAEQIRVFLGLGRITEKADLEAGTVVVVVGSDFASSSAAEATTTTGVGG